MAWGFLQATGARAVSLKASCMRGTLAPQALPVSCGNKFEMVAEPEDARSLRHLPRVFCAKARVHKLKGKPRPWRL